MIQESAASLAQRRANAGRKSLVGRLDAAADGEKRRQRPDQEQQDEHDQRDENATPPAPRPTRAAYLRLARLAPIPALTWPFDAALERDAAFDAPASVDAIRLLDAGHPAVG